MKHFVARSESEMKSNKLDSSNGIGAQKLVSGAPANNPSPHKLVARFNTRTQSHCPKSIYCLSFEEKVEGGCQIKGVFPAGLTDQLYVLL